MSRIKKKQNFLKKFAEEYNIPRDKFVNADFLPIRIYTKGDDSGYDAYRKALEGMDETKFNSYEYCSHTGNSRKARKQRFLNKFAKEYSLTYKQLLDAAFLPIRIYTKDDDSGYKVYKNALGGMSEDDFPKPLTTDNINNILEYCVEYSKKYELIKDDLMLFKLKKLFGAYSDKYGSEVINKVNDVVKNFVSISNLNIDALTLDQGQAISFTVKDNNDVTHVETILIKGKFLFWIHNNEDDIDNDYEDKSNIRVFKIIADTNTIKSTFQELRKENLKTSELQSGIFKLTGSDSTNLRHITIELEGNADWDHIQGIIKAIILAKGMNDLEELPSEDIINKIHDELHQFRNLDLSWKLEVDNVFKNAKTIQDIVDGGKNLAKQDLYQNKSKEDKSTMGLYLGEQMENAINRVIVAQLNSGDTTKINAAKETLVKRLQEPDDKEMKERFVRRLFQKILDKGLRDKLVEEINSKCELDVSMDASKKKSKLSEVNRRKKEFDDIIEKSTKLGDLDNVYSPLSKNIDESINLNQAEKKEVKDYISRQLMIKKLSLALNSNSKTFMEQAQQTLLDSFKANHEIKEARKILDTPLQSDATYNRAHYTIDSNKQRLIFKTDKQYKTFVQQVLQGVNKKSLASMLVDNIFKKYGIGISIDSSTDKLQEPKNRDSQDSQDSQEWQQLIKDANDIYLDFAKFVIIEKAEEVLYSLDENFEPNFLSESEKDIIDTRRKIIDTPMLTELLTKLSKNLVANILKFELKGTKYETYADEIFKKLARDVLHVDPESLVTCKVVSFEQLMQSQGSIDAINTCHNIMPSIICNTKSDMQIDSKVLEDECAESLYYYPKNSTIGGVEHLESI